MSLVQCLWMLFLLICLLWILLFVTLTSYSVNIIFIFCMFCIEAALEKRVCSQWPLNPCRNQGNRFKKQQHTFIHQAQFSFKIRCFSEEDRAHLQTHVDPEWYSWQAPNRWFVFELIFKITVMWPQVCIYGELRIPNSPQCMYNRQL